jgi:hypothetical protein
VIAALQNGLKETGYACTSERTEEIEPPSSPPWKGDALCKRPLTLSFVEINRVLPLLDLG